MKGWIKLSPLSPPSPCDQARQHDTECGVQTLGAGGIHIYLEGGPELS